MWVSFSIFPLKKLKHEFSKHKILRFKVKEQNLKTKNKHKNRKKPIKAQENDQ